MIYRVLLSITVVALIALGVVLHGNESASATHQSSQPQQSQQPTEDQSLKGFKLQ